MLISNNDIQSINAAIIDLQKQIDEIRNILNSITGGTK